METPKELIGLSIGLGIIVLIFVLNKNLDKNQDLLGSVFAGSLVGVMAFSISIFLTMFMKNSLLWLTGKYDHCVSDTFHPK